MKNEKEVIEGRMKRGTQEMKKKGNEEYENRRMRKNGECYLI